MTETNRALISLSELWKRIHDEDLEQIRVRFRSQQTDLSRWGSMRFGPADWAEVCMFDALAGRIQLLDEDGNVLAPGRTDLSDFYNEVMCLLDQIPTVADLEGYRIGPNGESVLALLGEKITGPAKLYSPSPDIGLETNILEDEAFLTRHMTLPLFWSRRTWQIDFSFLSAARELLSSVQLPQDVWPTNLSEHLLGAWSDLERKWRPFEGALLATDRAHADRSFQRDFRTASKVKQNQGGRPAKSQAAVGAYFARYPEGHQAAERSVTWDVVRADVIDEIGFDIGMSTLQGAVKSDPRWKSVSKK